MISWRDVVVTYLIEKQGNQCILCHEQFSPVSPPEVDHIKPVSNGGEYRLQNLQLLHSICNRRKGAKYNESQHKSIETKLDLASLNYRQKQDIDLLKEIKRLLNLEISQELIGKKLGLTRRQIAYLIFKYKLPKDPNSWELDS